jgi:hypothetical protein
MTQGHTYLQTDLWHVYYVEMQFMYVHTNCDAHPIPALLVPHPSSSSSSSRGWVQYDEADMQRIRLARFHDARETVADPIPDGHWDLMTPSGRICWLSCKQEQYYTPQAAGQGEQCPTHGSSLWLLRLMHGSCKLECTAQSHLGSRSWRNGNGTEWCVLALLSAYRACPRRPEQIELRDGGMEVSTVHKRVPGIPRV